MMSRREPYQRAKAPSSGHCRFDPVTLRAAGRLERMRRAGHLTPREYSRCLRELLALQAEAHPLAYTSLRREARRQAALGCGMPLGGARYRRCGRHGGARVRNSEVGTDYPSQLRLAA